MPQLRLQLCITERSRSGHWSHPLPRHMLQNGNKYSMSRKHKTKIATQPSYRPTDSPARWINKKKCGRPSSGKHMPPRQEPSSQSARENRSNGPFTKQGSSRPSSFPCPWKGEQHASHTGIPLERPRRFEQSTRGNAWRRSSE